MRYLLDTCSFIWLCSEPDQLTEPVSEIIDDGDSDLLLSDASALEIAYKWTAGKIGLPSPPRQWIERQISEWSLTGLRLTRGDIYRTTELPEYHKDPFDRLLVAVALNNNLTIITPDKAVCAYPVACVW